jgi:hypothetical protein
VLWWVAHIRIYWARSLLFGLGTIAFHSAGVGGGRPFHCCDQLSLLSSDGKKRGSGGPVALQQKMFISTAIGLAVMAGSFVFMEWLNHAVVHGDRFLARPEYGEALIKGVPNTTLLYVCATFFALAVLWALPFPRHDSSGTQDSGRMGKAARVAIFGATTILLVGALVDTSSKISGTASGQHGRAH